MTDPDRTAHQHGAPAHARSGARTVVLYALAYIATVAMSVPALSVFTDPQLAAAVWIIGAIALYVMSWRTLIAKGTTDYARGLFVLGLTVVSAAIAYYLMVTIFKALGFAAASSP